MPLPPSRKDVVGNNPPDQFKIAIPNNGMVSGIFGYINYLVEKDRKYIIETLVNGRKNPYVALACDVSRLTPYRPFPLGVSRLRLGRSRG